VSTRELLGAIRKLTSGKDLSAEESGHAFDVIMRGDATASQIAALLVGLRVKGETADEVAGAARAMRRAMVRLPAVNTETLVDTCGTGGGTFPTFNISTAAALLAAGAGLRIAKLGNRSFTSRSGSADVLEALGVRIDAPLETMTRALTDAGIVFMFAPAMHPAMRHVGPVRRELGVATVMNIVGPLANPAGAGRQVVGVAEQSRMPLLAGALLALGTRHALVVHGEPGLDELSPIGPTHIIEVKGGETRPWTLDPRELGFRDIADSELGGGGPEDNAQIISEVLHGRGPRGARAAVVLNAAAALYVGGGAPSIAQAVTVATAALEAGEGAAALVRLRAAYDPESPAARRQIP
jgi:anthranilate phosphoribosyltransferase